MPTVAHPTLRRLTICLFAVALGFQAVIWTTTPARADGFSSCAVSHMTTASQSSCWHPFVAGPFNTELPTDPALASDSAAVVGHMEEYGWSFNGSNLGFSLPTSSATRPVYFAQGSDPTYTIDCTVCSGDNRVNVSGAQIHMPAGAVPDGDTDGHLTVIEDATGQEYDFWLASVSGSTIVAHTAAVVNVNTGNGIGSEGDAAHFALSAGLLRPSELASGLIPHALVITVPCTNANGWNVGYTWPANGGWGDPCGMAGNEPTTGAPELGQLVRLNLSDGAIAASSAPAWEKTIMTALARYGAYIEDTDSNYANGMDILAQDAASWTSLGMANQWTQVAQLFGSSNGTFSSNVPIPVSDLEIIDPCVPEGTCPGANGPGPMDTVPTGSSSTLTGAPTAVTTTSWSTQTRRGQSGSGHYRARVRQRAAVRRWHLRQRAALRQQQLRREKRHGRFVMRRHAGRRAYAAGLASGWAGPVK